MLNNRGFPGSSAGKAGKAGSLLQCRRPRFNSLVRKIAWRRDRLPTPVFLDFLGGSAGKESACHAGDLGSIPGLGRSPGEGQSYPLEYLGLENSMDPSPWGRKESDMTEQLSINNRRKQQKFSSGKLETSRENSAQRWAQ